MRSRTIQTLQEHENADWFRAVGRKETSSVIVLASWQEALNLAMPIHGDDYGDFAYWDDVKLEAGNQYHAKVRAVAPDRAKQWNEVVREVRPAAFALVERKLKAMQSMLEQSGVDDELLPILTACVEGDMLYLALEGEFADVAPTGFFSEIGNWYLRGHFPCGWKGNYPAGSLVIY